MITGNRDGVDILNQREYRDLIKVIPQLGVDEKLLKPQNKPELADNL